MRRVFVGHRGVGKTSLIKRHRSYFPKILHFDLDYEIENFFQKTVSEIFQSEGEAKFREYELQIFEKIIKDNQQFVISLGAGFNPLNIKEDIEVIYVSRRTDIDGRIFLNRPKLLSTKSDLEEYLDLYHKREPYFRQRADFVYHLPEGIEKENIFEEKIFKLDFENKTPYLTVRKKNLFELSFPKLELRDDILSKKDINDIVNEHPDKKIIISHRNKECEFNWACSNHIITDWALECGRPPGNFLGMVSVHEGSLNQAISELSQYSHLFMKLCPVINSWEELIFGYRWQQQDPQKRNFLPRTSTSISRSLWRWFRLVVANKQTINFVQGVLDFDDQPSVYEFLKWNVEQPWGAVLGFPIHHSRTPVEQGDYGWNMVSIALDESVFDQAFTFLKELGIQVAAVTSPLKLIAKGNTLVVKQDHLMVTSTDSYGFQILFNQIEDMNAKIAVWGGDGVLNSIKEVYPDSVFYSARTGEIKNGQPFSNPDVIVWAAPRKSGIKLPRQIFTDWSPKLILDLNYTENSMGLDCAKDFKCNYISGLSMFKEQAIHQAKFWKDQS